MANMAKKMVFGSAAVCGLVALLAILDFAMGIPFNGRGFFDITLLLGAAGGLYMCWESYRDLR